MSEEIKIDFHAIQNELLLLREKNAALLKEVAALTADNERLAKVAGRLFKQVEHKPQPQ